jgi:hypothetical protein
VSISLLTPAGALFAVTALVPLAALALHDRRLRQVRAALRLDQPTLRPRLGLVVAVVAVPSLLALAMTQPVIRTTTGQPVRTDAQVFYVLDVSRSMLAAADPEGATRIQRATRAALRMRTSLASIPSGLASMTDRVVPHVFPTSDEEVFAAALTQSMRVNNPPPRGFEETATLFESLDAFSGTNLFSPGVKRRLVVVLTDGETREYYVPTLRDALARGPRTDFLIVRLSHSGERVWAGNSPDPGYQPDPSSAQKVRQLSSITHGSAFEEDEIGKAIGRARELVGDGPVVERGETLRVYSLARWIALCALAPLGYVLWRRNLV